MHAPGPIRLLDAEPDLGRFLTGEDQQALDGLSVPVVLVPRGVFDPHTMLAERHAFGAVVLDGMLVRRLRVGEQTGLRLLGPGDILGVAGAPASSLLVETGWQAAAPTRLALMGREVLLGSRRAPRLVAGIHARVAEQVDRVAVQLAICQLARVEHRLLALLWLLAESWGQVTPSGTALRLHLTHETLGGLVGARRPTVTLALGELSQRGSIAKQDRGWLLLEPPPAGARGAERMHLPELLAGSDMAVPAAAGTTGNGTRAGAAPIARATTEAAREIAETVSRLRARHDETRERMHRELGRVAEARRRSRELRERLQQERTLRALAAPSARSPR